jgi:hypothetical protein
MEIICPYVHLVNFFWQVGFFFFFKEHWHESLTHLLNSAQVMTLTSYLTLATLFLGLSPNFLLRDERLMCLGKLDISQFLQRALTWKFTHLLNSAQVMILTNFSTLATYFLGYLPILYLEKWLSYLGKLESMDFFCNHFYQCYFPLLILVIRFWGMNYLFTVSLKTCTSNWARHVDGHTETFFSATILTRVMTLFKFH